MDSDNSEVIPVFKGVGTGASEDRCAGFWVQYIVRVLLCHCSADIFTDPYSIRGGEEAVTVRVANATGWPGVISVVCSSMPKGYLPQPASLLPQAVGITRFSVGYLAGTHYYDEVRIALIRFPRIKHHRLH
jgi:hypothetical protein